MLQIWMCFSITSVSLGAQKANACAQHVYKADRLALEAANKETMI
jgi:hypothetical protein